MFDRQDARAFATAAAYVFPGIICALIISFRSAEPAGIREGLIAGLGLTIVWSIVMVVIEKNPARRCKNCQARISRVEPSGTASLCRKCREATDLAARWKSPAGRSVLPSLFAGVAIGVVLGFLITRPERAQEAQKLAEVSLFDWLCTLVLLLAVGVYLVSRVLLFLKARRFAKQLRYDEAASSAPTTDHTAIVTPHAERCIVCGRNFVPLDRDASREVCAVCVEVRVPANEEQPKPATPAKPGFPWIWVLLIISVAALTYWTAPNPPKNGQPPAVSPPSAPAKIVQFLALGATFYLVLKLYIWIATRLFGNPSGLARRIEKLGVKGSTLQSKPFFVWSTDNDPPVDFLAEQIKHSRAGVEKVLGQSLEKVATPGFLVFSSQAELRGVVEKLTNNPLLVDQPVWDFLSKPRSLLVSLEDTPTSVTGVERNIRAGAVTAFVEQVFANRTPPGWMLIGLSHLAVQATGLPSPYDNARGLKLSISDGRWLPPAQFVPPRSDEILEWYAKGRDQRYFTRIHQAQSQSWAMLDYLIGEHAPAERRRQFLSFLNAMMPLGTQQAIFREVFGFGYDELDEKVRDHVQMLALSAPVLPDLALRDRFDRLVIPLSVNPTGDKQRREMAIRSWGSSGFFYRLDQLMELLRDDSGVNSEVVRWALENITGEPLGPDYQAWRAWFDDLKPEALGMKAWPGAEK